MEINVYELLQQKSVTKTVTDVIKYALEDENVEKLNQIVIQFFVHALKRSKEITAEDLEDIESAEDLRELLHAIYCSPEVHDETEVAENVRHFIHLFVGESFANNLLNSILVSNWISWLKLTVTHPEIPNHTTFKQESLHLLSLFLIPLSRLSEVIPADNEVSSDDDLGKSVFTFLLTILELIPAGFKYKLLSVDIATQVINTIENHFEIFGREQKNVLQVYKKMMLVEDHFLHVMALKSLGKLCGIGELHEPLKTLFHEQQLPEGDESDEDQSFSYILNEFVGRKNLRVEVMSLLKAMRNLDAGNQIITEESRAELYMSIFNKSKKLVAETVNLIAAFGDDVWLQVINLLNYHVIDDVSFSKLFENLAAVEGFSCDAKDLLRITVENLNTPEVSQRAVFVVIEILKHDDSKQLEVLLVIDKLLIESMKDEKTFMLVIDCFNIIDIEILSNFLKDNAIQLVAIVNVLLEAFKQLDTPLALHNIVSVLNKIMKIAPEFTLKAVRIVFKQLLLDLVQADNQFMANQHPSKLAIYKEPMTKISVLLENRTCNLLNGLTMQMIFKLCKKNFAFAIEDGEAMLLTTLIRLFTNCYKHIWTRVLLGRQIPFHTKEIVAPLKDFYIAFEGIINSGELNIEEGHLVLSSFMDLAVMFQPSMKNRSTHALFTAKVFQVDKRCVNVIAALIEKLLFPEGSEDRTLDDATIFQCEFILESWTSFYKNYEALPSLTASEKIIRHYSFNQPLKGHIEKLMDHLLTQKGIFEQTVAFVTLNLSNRNDIAKFRRFHHALEIFLSHKYSDVKSKLLIFGTICSYILTKLDVQITSIRVKEERDRLMVLEFVILYTRNMSSAMKKTLIEYIPLDAEKENLSGMEKQHLTSFRTQLLQ